MTDTTIPAGSVMTIESLRLQLSTFLTRIQHHVSIETIRPLPVFLGLQSAAVVVAQATDETDSHDTNNSNNTSISIAPNAYSTPTGSTHRRTYEIIRGRIQENTSYYLSNYVFIAMMTGLVIVLLHPSIIVTFGIIYGLYIVHTYLIRQEVIICHVPIHTILTVQQRLYILFGISLLLIIITCVVPTMIFIVISSIIIFSHAVLRTPTNAVNDSTLQRGIPSSKQPLPNNNDTNNNEVDPLLSSDV